MGDGHQSIFIGANDPRKQGVPIHRAGIGMALAPIYPMELDHGTFGTSTVLPPKTQKKHIFPIFDYTYIVGLVWVLLCHFSTCGFVWRFRETIQSLCENCQFDGTFPSFSGAKPPTRQEIFHRAKQKRLRRFRSSGDGLKFKHFYGDFVVMSWWFWYDFMVISWCFFLLGILWRFHGISSGFHGIFHVFFYFKIIQLDVIVW